MRGAGCGVRAMTGTVPLSAYLILSAALFAIGVIGVVIRRNALIIFMAIELMLNAVNLTFVAFSKFLGSMDGQIIVFFVMAVAAAEVALGLAIIIALYRNKESVNVDDINLLRG
ncbi:MAG: nuoK [candidate division NC10 bacterium]|nr:nuoK [candidate division NC10 bacterium]